MTSGGDIYGGFWRRVLATSLDLGIISLLLVGLAFVLGLMAGIAGVETVPQGARALLGVLIIISGISLLWLYDALMIAGANQATPGKRAVGLKVVDAMGQPLSRARASARFWSKLLSAVSLLAGFLMVAFTPGKEALHDLIAGTRVVKKHATAADLAPSGSNGRRPGLTFIILLAVLALPVTLLVDVEVQLFSRSGPASLTERAAEGVPKAQYNLGVAYAKGKGVEKDYRQAVAWWRKAAGQGLAEARHNLGIAYAKGGGVRKNHDKAVEWLRKAAEQGVAQSQNQLAIAYSEGAGAEQSDRQAVKWWRRAAEQGNPQAQYYLGTMLIKGQGTKQDQRKGTEWIRKSADQGFEKAQRALNQAH